MEVPPCSEEAYTGISSRTQAQRPQTQGQSFRERAVFLNALFSNPATARLLHHTLLHYVPSVPFIRHFTATFLNGCFRPCFEVSSQSGNANHAKQITLLPRPPSGCALRSGVCSHLLLTTALRSEHRDLHMTDEETETQEGRPTQGRRSR